MKKEKLFIKTKSGKLKLLLLRPNCDERVPGILWIHGGGYATGMSSMLYFSRGLDIAKKHNCVFISPEFRRSIRHPYPAAFDDCVDA